MSMTNKLKKRLAVAAIGLTLLGGGPVYAGSDPTTPPSGGGPTPPTPVTPTIPTDTITNYIGVSTGLYNSLSSAMNILNWAQPLNFLGWSNNPSVPVSNQGAVSQSLGGNGGTSTGLVSTGGGSDPLSSLKSINDHVVVVETSTKPKRASTGNVKIDQAKTEQTEAAKKLLETAKSGNKDEMKKATEELQKKNDELKKVSEKEQNNTPNQKSAEQAAKDAAVKAAQEKLDQIRKDAFDKYADWEKAKYDVSSAEEKAELAARDYLNALKTGDPEIIAAYKERLQEANDALLEAKRNEEAAKQAVSDASYNVSRAQTELNNIQNNFTYSGGADTQTQQPSVEQQTTQQQTVEQPTQQQTAGQPVQQQGGGETNISMNDMLKAKLSSLTQKEAELAKQSEQQNKAAIGAAIRYNEAKESGASQAEIDRLKAEYDKAMAESNRLEKEHDTAKAELDSTRALVKAVELAKMTPPELAQKEAELAKQSEQQNKAAIGAAIRYNEAKESGASQAEIDRLKAEYDKAMAEANRLEKEHDAAKAEMEAAREAAWRESVIAKWEADKAEQQTAEQPVQQQGGGETTTTEQKSAEQSAKDAAVKAAQEKLDQIRKDAFDKYADWEKAKYDVSSAEEKAELAARDYLNALKTGDPEIISAYKERLQEANDALLEAKRNEEDAKGATYEASSNVARAQTELNNAQNNFNDSGAAGGETQQTTQQAVEQPTQQQTVEQQSQSQQGEQRTSVVETGGQSGLNIGGGERPVVETETTRPRTGASQQTMQGKISSLEQQKFIELDKKYQELNDAIDKAGDALLKAYNSGASQEELDRLDKEYDQLWDKRDLAFLDESVNKSDYLEWREQNKQQNQSQQGGGTAVVETGGQSGLNIGGGERPVVETETTRPRTGASQQPMQGNLSTLEQQKFIELDKKYQELNDAIDKAGDALLKAYNSGASQEELDRLDKEYDQLWDKRDLAFLDESVNKSDYLEWREQNKQQNQSQQGGGTAVVETGGQGGLNIGGGERPVVETETTSPRTGTSQQTTQEKVSSLEQKVNDLTKQYWASVKDRDQASRDYRDAQERGASQEELDRLKARYDELQKQKDSNFAEYRAAKAEQKVDDLTKQYWEGVKDRDQAGRDYREAQERGASQEELDRLKARYDELQKQKDSNFAEYRASKAEMQSAREAADAAKNELKDAREAADTSKQKQQTVEQPVQQQSGGETPITTQDPLKTKVSSLEQKESELTEQWKQNDMAAWKAAIEYGEAEKNGASQEELDRIQANHDEAQKENRRIEEERNAVRAELESARADVTAAELSKMTPAELKQKEAELTKQWKQNDMAAWKAAIEHGEAEKRGASQRELDRIQARHDEVQKENRRIEKERDAVRARLEAVRE